MPYYYVLISYLAGFCSSFMLVNVFVSRALKSKNDVRQIVSEVYHKDYFPQICTAEGLLKLYKLSPEERFVDMALEQLTVLKSNIKSKVKLYEDV